MPKSNSNEREFKRLYKKYKRKYKKLKRKINSRISPPILINQPSPQVLIKPTPVLLNSQPVLVRQSPVLFGSLSHPSTIFMEKKPYIVSAVLNNDDKLKFSNTIQLLINRYRPYLEIIKNEPNITLSKGPFIAPQDELQYRSVNEMNRILNNVITKYQNTTVTITYKNITIIDIENHSIVRANIESNLLLEMAKDLNLNNPPTELYIPLLYLKSNIVDKNIIIENCNQILSQNNIEPNNPMTIKSINLITPFRNNIFNLW